MRTNFDPKSLVQSYTNNNPGWWTPRQSEPINEHSGTTVSYRNRQQKWHNQKEGGNGWALIDGKIVEVTVCGKAKGGETFSLFVAPVDGAGKRVWVDIDHFSRRKGMIKRTKND